ncbi:MAG: phosphoglucosamine mutase [Clostridia bacterium]|nr:phosphoglucosamine mutase [Clostridia bacterium]
MLPQTDKVVLLCKTFKVTTDELLIDNIVLNNVNDSLQSNNKYFGTDGFRGEANKDLTSMHAYKVGRFLGWYYSSKLSGCEKTNYKPKIVIGKDTRRSSYMLEYALVAGLTASGADAYMLHVTTTPSVSYITKQDEFDCGIMITASHNPYYDNGIKIINKYGEKLEEKTISYIEAYLDNNLKKLNVLGADLPLATKEKVGCIIDYVSGRNRYLGYLISIASHSYKKLKIGIDCANGSSWWLGKALFTALGANIFVIGDEPNGLNVNENCGSTHLEKLKKLVKEQRLDMGFAFDGDADRCLAIDEFGNVVDGDKILYILGKRLKNRGILNENTLVCTVMSNSGLLESLEKVGIKAVQTQVGDKYVYEKMQENDYRLGGEQSGHIIVKKYATTGDGLLTAIMILEEVLDEKTTLSKLCEEVILYPNYLKNVKVKDKNMVFEDEKVLEKVKEIECKINGKGRVLFRKSGTEPIVRIMVETESKKDCENYLEEIVNVIKNRGYALD